MTTMERALNRLYEQVRGQHGTQGLFMATHALLCSIGVTSPAALLLNINAPFGKFAMDRSYLNLNGNTAWLVMEFVSPLTFVLSVCGPPLSGRPFTWQFEAQKSIFGASFSDTLAELTPTLPTLDLLNALTLPSKVLAILFIVHYANRSVISTLRQPTARAPIHFLPFIMACFFNLANGFLMGSWVGGRTRTTTSMFLTGGQRGGLPGDAAASPLFWLGISLWLFGFVGNLVHDEILYNLRRAKQGETRPRYSIPRGLMYDAPFGGISHPAYLCEWIEWTGYALAASSVIGVAPPLPIATGAQPSTLFDLSRWLPKPLRRSIVPRHPMRSPLTYLGPPWVFVALEVSAMLPRAISGHKWYKAQFGNELPKSRKAIFPGIL
ncbi:uncharacterized protein L969DRAFT_16404 [Mixia osmundae IAM 14324]|uniref:3-oxo-5-alpha-steroid 4-dehydrogenase C-terminal domain-containing protein n=1 Tax=Mixia osmundae (strain CBS 9802 / IAM 14324 / JCM 22182 / KY 12970) TaxID=764103 RepID=G7DUC2_MIXOS|nr:uncharacterized protein L969DRAFT_16404 [Mixia osmundae IAM 14324]KEI41054.1 hypothetical protein L969DRAFT_16404 [Mixia osmundae IAM 14324]GAA94182.1 hypothetical protein E5Q_00830 [Mixia osmundae IAM 14324]